MIQRRRASERFSPIVKKENKNYLNFDRIELENDGPKKGFILRLDSRDKKQSKVSEQKKNKNQEEKKKDQERLFGFQTFKKPIKSQDVPPTQCPRLTKNKSYSLKEKQELNFSPKLLVFKDEPISSNEDKDFQWKVETIEVLPPCEDFFYEVCNSDDDQVQKWHHKFEEYDMDSDKQNMPYSDDDQLEIDSDQEGQNKELLTSEQDQQIVCEQKRLDIPRYSFDSMLKKKLQQISEEDETSITNGFQFGK